MQESVVSAFDDIKIPARLKLFSLWTSIVFFYIYGDYFELYQPGKLRDMLAGRTALGTTSQNVLLTMSAIVVIPCLMPFLSLILPAALNRWANVISGSVYTIVMIFAILGGWHFYTLYGLLEIALTLLVVWFAWTWPRRPVGDETNFR